MDIVVFYANWCVPCEETRKDCKDIFSGFEIEEVELDKNLELARKYSVRNLPSVLVLDGEILVEKLEGQISIDQLERLKVKLEGQIEQV